MVSRDESSYFTVKTRKVVPEQAYLTSPFLTSSFSWREGDGEYAYAYDGVGRVEVKKLYELSRALQEFLRYTDND